MTAEDLFPDEVQRLVLAERTAITAFLIRCLGKDEVWDADRALMLDWLRRVAEGEHLLPMSEQP